MRGYKTRRMRLQTRIVLYFLPLMVAAVALIVSGIEYRKSRLLFDLHEQRGLSIARSLEAASSTELLAYNYVALQQLTDRAVEEEGVGYVIVLDKEGVVAGWSGRPDRQGKVLEDPVGTRATKSLETVIHRVGSPELGERHGLDIAVPVYVDGSAQKWGTVRVGLSLDAVHAELFRTRIAILAMGCLVLGVAFLVARELSRRITVPLAGLMTATEQLRRGNFDVRVGLRTGDEIEYLSNRFDEMATHLRRNQREIESKTEELAALNSSLEEKVEQRTRALTEAEEKYRTLVEFSPDPICIFQDGHLEFFNQAFTRTFGYSEAELQSPGFDPLVLIDPDDRDAFRRHLRGEPVAGREPVVGREPGRKPGREPGREAGREAERAAEAEEAAGKPLGDITGRHRDGSRIHLDLRSTWISYDDAPALEVLLVDVTEKRRLREKIDSYERLSALGEMASGVAHDFNNVLGTILARAQYLQQKARVAEVRRGLRIIEKAAEDGSETVRRIQDFSRVRTDREFQKVHVEEMLEDVLEMTRNRWEDAVNRRGNRIDIRRELYEGLCVEGNVHELREVFVNLIINSVDSIDGDGTLTLGSRMEDENVVITVSDTGHGMPEEVKRRLFDPFFSTKGVKGTGLGMSIVYGIITRHGGDIRVTSQEGEGTTFSIVLPGAGDGEVEQESSESRILARSGEGRILVVDDEEHIRDLVRDILSQAGFDVEVVAGGAEAIDSLRMAPFDLVVTDLGMPNVSGWEVSKAAKSMQADIRVLLLTGWGAALDSEEVARAGVDQTLAKPFKMVDLLHRAHQMLDGTRLRRSA